MTTIEAHPEDRIAVNTATDEAGSNADSDNFWQKLDTKSRVSFILNAVSVIVALGMVIMLLLITQSVRDLMTIEAKLSGLSEFESRLASQVNTGDNALHGRLNDVDTQLSNLSSQATALQTRLETLASDNEKLAVKIDRLEQITETASMASQPSQDPDQNRVVRYAPGAAADSGSDNQAPKLDTNRFQRTVTADGKVIYRRIN